MNRNKTPWMILLFAFNFSVVVYGVVAFLLKPRMQHPFANAINFDMVQMILSAVAVFSLAGSVLWLQSKLPQDMGAVPMPYPAFQSTTITALALSETCTICGLVLFFLGMPLERFPLFMLGTLAVNILFILPRGRAYFEQP